MARQVTKKGMKNSGDCAQYVLVTDVSNPLGLDSASDLAR